MFFAYLLKMEKVAKNGRKIKAIALLFCCFLPIEEGEGGREGRGVGEGGGGREGGREGREVEEEGRRRWWWWWWAKVIVL